MTQDWQIQHWNENVRQTKNDGVQGKNIKTACQIKCYITGEEEALMDKFMISESWCIRINGGERPSPLSDGFKPAAACVKLRFPFDTVRGMFIKHARESNPSTSNRLRKM